MNFGNVARVLTVAAACFAAVGSATSNTNNGPAAQQQQSQMDSPPPPQQMDASRALGLWRSTFGAVKIEADNAHGGLQAGAIQGVWMYQRQGQDVIGYFYGTLQGNVLKFRWQEPNNPPLTGEGFIVFDQSGRQYSGRWWSDQHDRVGDWNGSRAPAEANQQYPGQQYGGTQYGGTPAAPAQAQYPQQQPYPPPQQQPYPPQQQPYPPQQQPQYPPQQQPQYPPQQPQYPPQQQPYPPQQQPYYPQR